MSKTKQTRAGATERAARNCHDMGDFVKTEALRLNTLGENGSKYSPIEVSRCKDCDAPIYFSEGRRASGPALRDKCKK